MHPHSRDGWALRLHSCRALSSQPQTQPTPNRENLTTFPLTTHIPGSGNFLFVAYRSLRELEQRLLLRLFAQDKRQFAKVGLASGISPRNFFGLDVNENAVETAKVT